MESLLSRALTERPYAPIFITIFFAILVSIAGAISHTLPQAQVFTPEGEGVSAQAHAGLLNALILVIPAAGGSFIILYLIRKGRLNLLLSLYKFLFFLLSSMVFYFIGDIPLYLIQSRTIPYFPGYFLSYRAVLYSLNWDAPFAVGVTVSAIVASQLFSPYSDRRRKNTSLMVLSGILGGFMAVTLPTWTVLIVLLLLSAYDIYAVFYGPIKEITSMSVRGSPAVVEPRDIFSSLVYQGKEWELGMGDLVFYSLLTSHAAYYGFTNPVMGELSWALFLFPVLLSLLVGFYITERLLERIPLLPGLPIPMGMGVGTFLALLLIL